MKITGKYCSELYLAKETLMDWPCFETRRTFVLNY